MKAINDYINLQKKLNKELQQHADIIDILFLLFCIILPFFTENILINVFLFSFLGIIYIKLIVIQSFPY